MQEIENKQKLYSIEKSLRLVGQERKESAETKVVDAIIDLDK
jgi:hypothetical protein